MPILIVCYALQQQHAHHAIQDIKEQHANYAAQDIICQWITLAPASPASQRLLIALLVLIAPIARSAIQQLIQYHYAHVLQVTMNQMLAHIHALNAHQRSPIAISVQQLHLVGLVKMDILDHYVTLAIQQAFFNLVQVPQLLVLLVFLIALPVLLQPLVLSAHHHILLMVLIDV